MQNQNDRPAQWDGGQDAVQDLALPETESESIKGGEAITLGYGAIQQTYTQQKRDGQ